MGENESMNQGKNSRVPFWRPWGIVGYMWRFLLFLGGIIGFCLLFAVLMDYNKEKRVEECFTEPYRNLPPLLKDSLEVREWVDSIPGVPELPDPNDNFIPPVDTTRIITNPEDSIGQIVCDQLTVLFNSKDIKQDMASFARQFKQYYPGNGYDILYYNPLSGMMLLLVPQNRLLVVADELPQRIRDIDFRVATNEILEECGRPSDSGFSVPKYDEYFKLIQAYEAWDITRGNKDVKVGIVDSYFDLTHPEIGERYVNPIHIPSKTRNVLPPLWAPRDEGELASYCHGSHVAGIAIGCQNNALGCSGIAPECTWIPIALGSQLTTATIVEGILYAVYQGADVVNFSIGANFPKEVSEIPLGEQVKAAVSSKKRGEALWEYVAQIANDHLCVLCTSAGNQTILMGLDSKNRSSHIIKVEAVDGKGQMAKFSNFGKVPEVGLDYSTVAAPGVNLWSVTDRRCTPIWQAMGDVVSVKDGLQEMSGTSMAAPVVTGAVALLKSKNRNLTTEQVIKILTLTAKQTDTKHRIGPTIQIKDALDATGGDLLNFDDLMKDHNKLLGKWRSTYEIDLVEEDTKKKLDEIWAYFIFSSTSRGTLEYHAIQSKRIYKAPISVVWGKDRLKIIQHGKAISSDGDTVNEDDFICRPNKDRLLETSAQRNGKERYTFQLEKVN